MPLILPVHLICNTSDEDLYSNIRANSRLPKKWVALEKEHDGVAVLCGSGPSLADTLSEIREHAKAGHTIFAMNGAAKFLASHGILPDYQCIIDAREQTADLVGPAKEHLFASQVHPKCFELAPDAKVWHLQIEGIEGLFPEYEGAYALIGGAASVGNTATCLAYTLGFRHLHCYGYDSSHKDGSSHAFAQPMNAGDPCAYVDFRGKTYLASLTMKLQAEKFQETAAALQASGCRIEVHGTGLLPDIFNAPKEEISEVEKYRRMWALDDYRAVAPGEDCVDVFLAQVKPDGEILDFGCGTGRASLKLINAGHKVTALDFADNCRDEAAKGIPFIVHDLMNEVPRKAPFGFCTDVMEHIPTDCVEIVLKNILTAANTVFFQISTVHDVMGAHIGHPLHLTVRPHSWWKKTLEQFGTVTWEEVGPISSLFVVRT